VGTIASNVVQKLTGWKADHARRHHVNGIERVEATKHRISFLLVMGGSVGLKCPRIPNRSGQSVGIEIANDDTLAPTAVGCRDET